MEEIEYIDLNLASDDTNSEDNVLTQPLELFFQEIEIAVQTGPGEIWGIKESINLHRYLFNRYVTITQIRNEISSFIGKNCQHATVFPHTVSVETIKATDTKELIYITVKVNTLNQYGESEDFLQKFLLGN